MAIAKGLVPLVDPTMWFDRPFSETVIRCGLCKREYRYQGKLEEIPDLQHVCTAHLPAITAVNMVR